jgi:hemerythrin-like domain-containing protein
MVMLREHGQMWPILDRLDQGLVEKVGADVLGVDCRELLALLQLHNPKEEQILYPELDRVVGEDTGADVHELLDAGQVPAGWTCQFLRAEHGRR